MKIVTVPDLGDFKNVPIIEILVAPGDIVTKDQPVAVVESDKATMEIPSVDAGVVTSIHIKIGDKVSAGSALLTVTAAEEEPPVQMEALTGASIETGLGLFKHTEPPPETAMPPGVSADKVVMLSAALAEKAALRIVGRRVYAGPSVRKIARELGVDLSAVKGSGPRGRIVAQDVRGYVKSVMPTRVIPHGTKTDASSATAVTPPPFTLLPWPKVDFAKFGPIDSQPLSRIRKISAANLHRNWVMIPHVTNHDDADITDLEAFRDGLNRERQQVGKLSPLAFIVKACVAALRSFPQFNASLDGDTLVLKRYFHIGFAADTPDGLVVPVVRNADQKGIVQIAEEMAELAAMARGGKLSGADMQGGSFSISSLGGIGGSYFTPIINAPEIAILGIGKAQTRVAWHNGQPQPRRILPLSLSWDHRAVDGAAAGRFNAHLVQMLGDVRRLLL